MRWISLGALVYVGFGLILYHSGFRLLDRQGNSRFGLFVLTWPAALFLHHRERRED